MSSLIIGYGFADKSLIQALNKIRQPFNSNSLAQEAACYAIQDNEHIDKSVQLNTEQRSYLMKELTHMTMD